MYLDEEVVRQLYEAFNRGDFKNVLKLFSDDILFHFPGRNKIAGDHRGRDEVLHYWNKMYELGGGSFRPKVNAVITNDEHIIVLSTITGERNGNGYSWKRVIDFVLRDSRVVEAWIYEGDQYASDEVFS
jgi:uncharacterized protein